ncbi:LpqB family beta-propeller domain-containing protein [Aeromicrobium sp. CF3.5]|uniref:LpqB family beta-propeller domain-containing protein n=1 Tax=Aeromicrobium sp. CF3.5 TaxID=3373078 RepID=UPI003EE4C932
MTAARRTRPHPMVMVLLAVVMTAGGCAAIPTSGPVSEVPDDRGMGQSTVRYSPAPPVDGASPGEVVRGYLDAMLAYPPSTRTAAAFLTPDAAESWERQSGVTVYRDAKVASQPEGVAAEQRMRVGVDAMETGRLDLEGRYDEGRGVRSTGYTLERSDGQWRISDPQPGLMVTAKFFADYYRPFNLYYFDRPARRLVPQLVHLLVDDRLAAALVTALARGGDDELEQTRTFVPQIDDLRATVPVDDGVADIGFTSEVADEADAGRLSAQIIWTLRQVPGVEAARISAGIGPIQPSGSARQPISSWQEFGASEASGTVYALQGDRVVEIDQADVTAIDGPWGEGTDGAVGAAVSEDRVALVDSSRSTVRIAQRTGDVELTIDGEDLIDPIVDADGDFWLVDRPGGVTRVRSVTPGPFSRVREVEAPELADLQVRSFEVSADASRYVVTAGVGESTTVRVGRIERGEDDAVTRLSAPSRLDAAVRSKQSAVWSDASRVSYLASGGSGVQVKTVLIDGSSASANLPGGRAMLSDVGANRLVVSSGPDQSSYITDRSGQLWYLTGSGSWNQVDDEFSYRSLNLAR